MNNLFNRLSFYKNTCFIGKIKNNDVKNIDNNSTEISYMPSPYKKEKPKAVSNYGVDKTILKTVPALKQAQIYIKTH